MSKCKTIISWLLVIATVTLSFGIFPFFSSTLPNYIGNEYYHDVYKPKTINTTKYIDEIFPWQYYDENEASIYQKLDVIDDIEKQAESFLKSTMFSDVNISLDFSQHTERCGSDFLYIHNYKLIVDSTEYLLNLSYDTADKLIVMLHCDSGGIYNRNIIADGETKIRQIITEYEASKEYSDGNKLDYVTPDSIHHQGEAISDYLFQVALVFDEIDIYSMIGDDIILKLDDKNICLCFANDSIILYWNPYSCIFEGYSMNTNH